MFRRLAIFSLAVFLLAIGRLEGSAFADDSNLSPLNKALNLDPVLIGGFVDTYYSYDANEFSPRTRDYLTQPVRDREPAVNLAFLEAKLNTDTVRGRLAGQVGTSVDTNYAAEPAEWTRYLQEAWIGYRLSEKLWLDGGIYFSHIGPEGFISRDNWAYTRLLMSEFSPYYESGAKLTYQHSDELSFQLHVVNGWQNVSDFGDHHPSLGTQVSYALPDGTTYSYNTFLGAEAEGIRFFNDLYAKVPVSALVELGACFDIGTQQRENSHPHAQDQWYTWALLSRFHLSPDLKATSRVEQYLDHNNVIVSTANGRPFDVTSFSLGIDYQMRKGLWWRNEYRAFFGGSPVFRKDSNETRSSDQFVVTSLSYSF